MATSKLIYYYVISSLLMLLMVIYACITREQFYPIILLLVTSKVSFLLLTNIVFAFTLFLGQILIKLFFGTLRDVEVELIMERSKYSIAETCLALTIFRNDLSPMVFSFFVLLLFLKIFHWLSRSRLDYLEQVARVSLSTHAMLFIMLLLLIVADSIICYNCVIYTLSKGKTVIVLFSFEFGVLILTALNNLIRYLVNLVDGMYENGLNYKGLYFMILDLICDGLKFCTYAGFFCLVFVYYGLPIHIIRDVWIAFTVFYQRLISLIKYLKLTNRLEERFEDATPEELAEAHECLICREGMDRGKKLPCKHVFHLDCLRMWLQHQQTCPLCRAEIPIVALPNSNQANQPAANEPVEDPGAPARQAQDGNIDIQHANILPGPAAALQQNQHQHEQHFHQNNNHHQQPSSLYLDEDTNFLREMHTPTSPHQIRHSIPGFFVVVAIGHLGSTNPTVDVKAIPSYLESNQTIRTIPQNTIVFASEFLRVTPQGEPDNLSVIWLKLPDGWVPLEEIKRFDPMPVIISPLLRPYSPIVTKRTFLGDSNLDFQIRTHSSPRSSHSQHSQTHSSQSSTPATPDSSILPQVAASSERAQRRLRESSGRREQHLLYNQRLSSSRSKYTSSPSSISRAIMKAKDDISALTQSLREASGHSNNPPRFDPPSPHKSTFSGRVTRLLAMQQQIDILSSSIVEIQESLSTIREGLASALADELNVQEHDQESQFQSQITTTMTATSTTTSAAATATAVSSSPPPYEEKSSSDSHSLSMEEKQEQEDQEQEEKRPEPVPFPDLNEVASEPIEVKQEEVCDMKKNSSISNNENPNTTTTSTESKEEDIRSIRARYFENNFKTEERKEVKEDEKKTNEEQEEI